jgi:uridylate kinase
MSKTTLPYKRILLKMSGGALMSRAHHPLDPSVVRRIIAEIKQVQQLGVEIGIVIGGGNFYRGATLAPIGIDRVTADYMGMMGTLINALALRDALEKASLSCRIFSAIAISGIADEFHQLKAIHHLKRGRVEIRADVILKATDVDGIYSSDPMKDSSAKLYTHLTYDEAIDKNLGVMDLSAFCQCRDYDVVLKVFNMTKPGALLRAVLDQDEGTTVTVSK